MGSGVGRQTLHGPLNVSTVTTGYALFPGKCLFLVILIKAPCSALFLYRYDRTFGRFLALFFIFNEVRFRLPSNIINDHENFTKYDQNKETPITHQTNHNVSGPVPTLKNITCSIK